MELTVTNRSRAYPGRSSEDSKVDEVQYVVLKVCYLCTSGSVVEYRLAKARVAGSNPVSCSQRNRKKSHPMDGSFFYVRALPGSNGSNVYVPLRSSQANVPRMFDCTGFALFIRIANSGPEEVVRRIHNNSGIGESIYSDIIKSMSESM